VVSFNLVHSVEWSSNVQGGPQNGTVFTCDSIYAIARICYRPSVCPSVCLSVTQVDHTKTDEVRIMKFSPYGNPIPLVFVG